MKTFIKQLDGSDVGFVNDVIFAHSEWYGDVKAKDFIHTSFFGVYTESNEIIGFFGICPWGFGIEVVLAYVYIGEEFRQQGIFNKIVKFVKNKFYEYPVITIGAKDENELANKIYSKKFTFLRHDDEDKGNWYIIRDNRK